MDLTAEHLRGARALLAISQGELARRARVGSATVKRLEAAKGALAARNGTIDKLRRALERAGVEFLEGPGVRLRRTK